MKEIKKLIKKHGQVCCPIPLILEKAKEKGYTKKQTLKAIEDIMRAGDGYMMPEMAYLL